MKERTKQSRKAPDRIVKAERDKILLKGEGVLEDHVNVDESQTLEKKTSDTEKSTVLNLACLFFSKGTSCTFI
jgi:hypothetical protein